MEKNEGKIEKKQQKKRENIGQEIRKKWPIKQRKISKMGKKNEWKKGKNAKYQEKQAKN